MLFIFSILRDIYSCLQRHRFESSLWRISYLFLISMRHHYIFHIFFVTYTILYHLCLHKPFTIFAVCISYINEYIILAVLYHICLRKQPMIFKWQKNVNRDPVLRVLKRGLCLWNFRLTSARRSKQRPKGLHGFERSLHLFKFRLIQNYYQTRAYTLTWWIRMYSNKARRGGSYGVWVTLYDSGLKTSRCTLGRWLFPHPRLCEERPPTCPYALRPDTCQGIYHILNFSPNKVYS